MSFTPPEAQYMNALESANRTRSQIAELKAELRAGTLTVVEALDDPRAAPMTIKALLSAQYKWGTTRVHRALRNLRWETAGPGQALLWPDTRVRDLTERQRELLRGYLS